MATALATVTPSRIAAAETLADMRGGALLDHAFDQRAALLNPRDRRWTQELCWGMLRKRGWIDAILAPRTTGGLAKLDPEIVDLLRIGVYQLLEMGSVPPYAAIGQTVEVAKRRHGLGASKLVNAVLRRVDRERDALLPVAPTDPIDALALQFSHPRWLVARWVARWGADETRALLAANNTEAPMIVRPWGMARAPLEAMLQADGVSVADAPLVPDSIQLGAGTALRGLAAFREGRCFVQDPAATLVVRYAAISAGARVADLCAAPGGKAVELARTAGEVIAADSSGSPAHPGGGDGRAPRARDGDADRPRRAGGRLPRPLRRGARRRPLHRDRHLPPAPRCPVAAQALRPRGDGGDAAHDPPRGGRGRHPWRAPDILHLFARTGGERRAGRVVPRRSP